MKKVSFALAACVLALTLIGCSSGTSSSGSQKEAPAAETAEPENNTPQEYGIGDTAVVGDVEYTLISAELSDERNQFDDSNPAAVVKISYTVKNNSDGDITIGTDCDVYGSDGKKCKTYPNENTLGSVASGKAMDVVSHYGLSAPGEIELQFSPLMPSGDPAIFKVTV